MLVNELLGDYVILGLDIAKEHTGIFVYNRGEVWTTGFRLTSFRGDDFEELRLRRDLRDRLLWVCDGLEFDYIVIEDVYGGSNFQTVRALLNLNNVIDELIVDGLVACKCLLRVVEPVWFGYFSKYVSGLGYKGVLRDRKAYVRGGIEFLGHDFSEGSFSEDRYDACGMALGMMYGISFCGYKKGGHVYRESDLLVRWSKGRPKGDFVECDWDGRGDIVDYMCRQVSPGDVYVLRVCGDMLGSYALRRGFSAGDGYLVFRLKKGV